MRLKNDGNGLRAGDGGDIVEASKDYPEGSVRGNKMECPSWVGRLFVLYAYGLASPRSFHPFLAIATTSPALNSAVPTHQPFSFFLSSFTYIFLLGFFITQGDNWILSW